MDALRRELNEKAIESGSSPIEGVIEIGPPRETFFDGTVQF